MEADCDNNDNVADLENIWREFHEEHDDKEKMKKAQLFLFKYHLYKQTHEREGDQPRFLSTVPSQLSFYLLQLVYDIICTSIASENVDNFNTEGSTVSNEPDSNNLVFHPSMLILKAPSDITAIVSLREFLTSGLGRAILEFLYGCDTKLITCKRELGCLLMNLFPSSSWDNTNAEPFEPCTPLSFSEYIDRFALTKESPSNPTRDSWPTESDIAAEVIYVREDFDRFRDRHISSTQHAFLILDILLQLVGTEANQSLDEKSVTTESLQFALDILNTLRENRPFQTRDHEIIKFKLLSLLISSVNNIFSKEKNIEVIPWDEIFVKGLQAISANFVTSDEPRIKEHQVSSSLVTTYVFFGLVYNSFLALHSNRDEFIQTAVEVFSDNRRSVLVDDLKNILRNMDCNPSANFAPILHTILATVNACRASCAKEASVKRKPKTRRKNLRKSNSSQSHCKGRSLSCMLENVTLKLFPLLDINLQLIVIKNFERSFICCCCYESENIKLVLNASPQAGDSEKHVYRFLSKQILNNLFSDENCPQCSAKSASSEFQKGLLLLYIEKYRSIVKKRELIMFLRHLLRITAIISNRVSEGILTSIAIPVFHDEMRKDAAEHSKNTQTILICLRIFRNCLVDIRLVEMFFLDENVNYLKSLIYVSDLVHAVCALLNIALNSAEGLIEENGHRALYDELKVILLDVCCSSSVVLHSMFARIATTHNNGNRISVVSAKKKLGPKNVFHDLLQQENLNIPQLLLLAVTYWDLTLELCCVNVTFKADFKKEFDLLKVDDEVPNNPNERSVPKLLQFICLTLSCFLSHKKRSAGLESSSALLRNSTSITLDEFFVVSLDEAISRTYDYVDLSVSASSANTDLLSITSNLPDRRTPLSIIDSDTQSMHRSFDEVTALMSLNEHCTANEVLARLKTSDSGEKIFDIRNQCRGSNCHENSLRSNVDEPEMNKSHSFIAGLDTLNTLLSKSVSYLLGNGNGGDSKLDNYFGREAPGPSWAAVCCDIDFISDEKLSCLQTTSTCKRKLLRIFTSSLAALMLETTQGNERNMQTVIRQLRNLLLPSSKQLWDDVENANAIIQVLNALLKVAEMTGTDLKKSSERFQSKFDKSVSDSSQDTTLRMPVVDVSNSSVDINHEDDDDDNEQIESEVDLSENEQNEQQRASTDDGYEADAEIVELTDSSQDEKDLFRRYSPSSQYRSHVVNEGLCNLIVEVLMELSVQCIKKPEYWVTSLTQLMKHLANIRDSLGGTLFLLQGFSKVLSLNDSRLRDFQQSILDLITDLREPDCLAAYFNILAAENPPVEILLQHMALICDKNIEVTPYVAMEFPMPNDASVSYLGDNPIYDNVKQIRNLHEIHEIDSVFTRSPCFIPVPNGTIRPFTEDGFTISTWIRYNKNSDSAKHRSDCDETHILSFGTQQLITSLYVHEDGNLFIEFFHPTVDITHKNPAPTSGGQQPCVRPSYSQSDADRANGNHERLCQLRRKRKGESLANAHPPRSSSVVHHEREAEGFALRQLFQSTTLALLNSISSFTTFHYPVVHPLHGARVESDNIRLPENKWTHVCISLCKKASSLNLTIVLDGTISYPFDLPWNSSSSSTKREFEMIAVGEMYPVDVNQLCSTHEYVSYSMSNVLAFKKYLSPTVLANLTALGPECSNFIYCQASSTIPNYGLLDYQMYSIFELEPLQEALKLFRYNLTLSYAAYEPNCSIHYTHGESGPNILGNRRETILYTRILPVNIASLQNATYICGGLSCLLILFAKTVELSNKPEVQAIALNILLRVALTDSRLYTEFIKKDTLNLIGSVIKTPQCSKSVHLLRVLLNSACSLPVCQLKNGEIRLTETAEACVVYPNIIVNTIKRYSDWSSFESSDSTVIDMLLQCIKDLIHGRQFHQAYNISQFTKAGLVKELLNLCKVYLVEAPCPVYFSKKSACLFIDILDVFAGAPPLPSLLDEITKLLLILQKPNECYITDNRSKFYFLLTDEIPTRQRGLGLPLTSSKIRLSIRRRKITFSPATERQLHSHSELNLTKCEHLLNRKSNKSRQNKLTSFIYDLDTLQTIAKCSEVNERRLCAARWEHNERFRKFLLELKHKNVSRSKVDKKELRKTIKKRQRKMSSVLEGDTPRKVRKLSSDAEDEAAREDGFDIVHSDEISSLEEAQSGNSKKSSKAAKGDVYYSPGVVTIQEGLYHLLHDYLLVLPDSCIDDVLEHYVKFEIILVLANHRNSAVRTAIIRLLIVYCDRLTMHDIQVAEKQMFWYHLANQLTLHPADEKLVDTCIEWVCRIPKFSINSDVTMHELKIHNKFAVSTLLAMSVQTVHNIGLATNVFKLIEEIYRTDRDNTMLMIERGLLQTTAKSLEKIYFDVKMEYRKAEGSIRTLFTTVADISLCSSGRINVLWELFNILTYYGDSNFTKVMYGFRGVQAHVILTLIEKFLPENDPNVMLPKLKDLRLPGSNISTSETRTRFELLIDRGVQFFVRLSNTYHPTAVEVQLFELLIKLGISGNLRCSNLLAWGLSPNRILTFKNSVTNHLLALLEQSSTLPTFTCDWKMIKAFLWKNRSSGLNGDCSPVTRLCRKLSVTEHDVWSLNDSLEKLDLNRTNCLREQTPMIEKALYKFEMHAQSCTDTAMMITRTVAELQVCMNSERKTLLNMMRQYDEGYIYAEWKLIIQRMTHEGTPWHCPSLYPKSWELDDTEGPSRSRTRLRRCWLHIDPKYMMSDFQTSSSPSNEQKSFPLKYLLASHDQQINFSLNAQLLFNFPAKFLPVDGEIDGELIVTEEKLFFSATHRYKFFYISSFIGNITEVWLRRYQHHEIAFEFFVNTNKSFFFVVHSKEDRETLKEIFADKIVNGVDPAKLMHEWKEGRLTNWEYLMALNQVGGRTYNDLMQYPVFPWILADYSSDCLDLTQKSSFRRLERPIAVQHEENEDHYISNYEHVLTSLPSGETVMKPYHYSSHYSNSGTVLHFLVRVPPFTRFFLRYQDNNFDLPDRTFHCLNTTWKLASKESPTDVKELIPEFFCLPEMFENFEGFNFGHRQNGEIVNHVTLPAWSSNNARLFVLIHRQALESEMVRKNLHHWIDLIFGFKQTGPAAVQAINVFHPSTYPDFETDSAGNSVDIMAFRTMVKTYGQMPRQLFKHPHESASELNYSPHQPSVLTSVKGLRWGIFTGSPQLENPKICSVYKQSNVPYSTLVPFESKNTVYCLHGQSSVMLGTDTDCNLVSWDHGDNIVRIQPLNDNIHASKPLLYNDPADPIACCGSHSMSNVLWFGHKSGKITVYMCTNHDNGKHERHRSFGNGIRLSYNSAFRKISRFPISRIEEFESLKDSKTCKLDLGTVHWSGPSVLIRHTDEVTDISLSIEFKIAVSIGRDGLAVIWDLNSMNYIRTIDRPSEIRHSPLNIVAISPSLGDIFTVHSIEVPDGDEQSFDSEEECFEVTEDDFVNVSMNFNGMSIMRLHTVNGKYVNHVIQEERILCACYSYIKEGIGVNVIATGFEGGTVKLWSSWDLSLIREILGSQSVISLAFSTYQHLAVLTKDYIQVWDSAGLLGDPPKFPQFLLRKGSNA